MTITLYDLAAGDPAIRFSPNCWRVRMALAHKGLEAETIPWRFTDKDAIAFSKQGTVPVIVDGDQTIYDSWAIAEYLDETYPDKPLFDCVQSKAQAFFIKNWVEKSLNRWVAQQVVFPIFEMLAEQDQDYFRTLREKTFGMTLEAFHEGATDARTKAQAALASLGATLADQPFVSGEAPAFSDYLVFGAVQWARVSSPVDMLVPGDPVTAWRERMLDLFDGLGRSMPARAG